MQFLGLCLCLLFITSISDGQTSESVFKVLQLKNKTVKELYKNRYASCKDLVNKKGIKIDSIEIYIRVLKKEMIVELWAKNKTDTLYKHIIDYPFCASSGSFGPKRANGDLQIPEGFYTIDAFDPNSNFYLALGINFPNKADLINGADGEMGGSISIYGECKSNGCVAIKKSHMEELYLFAVEAKDKGQEKIEVHIFPQILDQARLNVLLETVKNKTLINFWDNMSDGYMYFEQSKKLPTIFIDKNGKYFFLDPY